MTGVVLRCPNCGTTRATPGECAACHEEEVRYFCSNHEPGRWIDTPACSACGAVFGAKPPAPPPARPPTARAPAPKAAAVRPPRMSPPGVPPGHAPRAPRAEPEDAPRGRPTSLPELLIELARESERRRAHRAPDPEPEAERPEPVVRRPAMGGCLLRALMIMFFLFLLLSSGFMGFFRIF